MTDDARTDGAPVTAVPTEAELRAASRLGADYVLRSLNATQASMGLDLVQSVVLATIVQANVAHLDQGPREDLPSEGPPPDHLRRPVSVLAVAGNTGLPYETARRTVMKLCQAGLCKRVRGGVIAPGRVLQGPPHAEGLIQNWRNLRRLVIQLERAGLLERP